MSNGLCAVCGTNHRDAQNHPFISPEEMEIFINNDPSEDMDGSTGEEIEFDCHMGRDGLCGAAGSEECEFRCPFNRH